MNLEKESSSCLGFEAYFKLGDGCDYVAVSYTLAFHRCDTCMRMHVAILIIDVEMTYMNMDT